MNHKTLFISAAIFLATLSGCGGGGGDAGSSGNDNNVFRSLAGTYAVACKSTTIGEDGSVTIDGLSGSDRAQVSVNWRQYSQPSCASSTLVADATAKGEIRSLGKTKTYTHLGQTVTAQVVEFTYTALTISKGSYSGSLPTFGTTTQMAYLLDGNKLYLSRGSRDADGVGTNLSPIAGVKQ